MQHGSKRIKCQVDGLPALAPVAWRDGFSGDKMQGLSQAIFVVLKGVSIGFGTLVLVGVLSFFSYVKFIRSSPKHAWLWATIVSLIFLGGMLYFGSGKELMAFSSSADDSGSIAHGADESDLWFGFAANAIGGLIGIFAGIKLRIRYWPANPK